MSLETSRKVLKVSGILCIIGAVVGLVLAIIALVTGGAVAGVMAKDPALNAANQASSGVGSLIGAGIGGIVGSIVQLFEGVVSIKASSENRYGKPAYFFAILGLIGSIVKVASQVLSGVKLETSSYLGLAFSIIISVVIFLAAKKVNDAYGSEH